MFVLDDMRNFRTEHSNEVMEPDDPDFDDTLFLHADEEVLILGKHIKSHGCLNEQVTASTFGEPTMEWTAFGMGAESQPEDRAVIYVCFTGRH
jgi:hypothetical protein